jgi:hypothetical protein
MWRDETISGGNQRMIGFRRLCGQHIESGSGN